MNTKIELQFGEKEYWTTPLLYSLDINGTNINYIQAPMMYD